MRRCSKCILTDYAVPIGDDGVCTYCRTNYETVPSLGEEAFVSVLERHRAAARERGAAYDCIVPVSGGRDSMYTLYALVKKYGMKPLAFNYTQGFVEPQAARNLETGVGILGVELARNENNNKQHRYLRHNLLALTKARPKHRRLVELMCTGCDTGYVDAAEELARERKVNLIVQGGCGFEPHLRGYITSDVRIFSGSMTATLIVEEMKEFLANPDLFMDPRYPLNGRHFCYTRGLIERFIPKRREPSGIERIHYFHYVPWKYREHVAELEREISWRRPEDRCTTMRFDCRLHILVDRFRVLYQGFSEREAIFSSMIRKGVVTREEALVEARREMAEEERLVDTVIEEVARTTGLEDRIPEIRRLFHARTKEER